MPSAGSPMSKDFHSDSPPEAMIRSMLTQTDELGDIGYSVEGHSTETLILVRRFVPSIVYRGPLAVAVVAVLVGLGLKSGDSGGIGLAVALICLVLAGILALTVRRTEKVSFSATPEGEGSRVLVSGVARPKLRTWVESMESRQKAPADS